MAEKPGEYAGRFRATPALLKLCSDEGVPPNTVLDHFKFEYELPKHPLELRARKRKNFYGTGELVGEPMEFKKTPVAAEMGHAIRELNGVLRQAHAPWRGTPRVPHF